MSTHPVSQHYTRENLLQAIDDGLRNAGKDPHKITIDDLAGIDQFHLGGKDATLQLTKLAQIGSGENVLDVGGGIGGPARTLVSTRGCNVTVLDLTEEFLKTGRALSDRMGFDGQVRFVHGNALEMPFEDESFDVAWTQHATMNIEHKEKLYREIHRVLKPGGRFAMHDFLAGENDGLEYPVPWARSPEISFVRREVDTKEAILGEGFEAVIWHDETAAALGWLESRVSGMIKAQMNPASARALGIPVILGPSAPLMFQNIMKGMQNGSLKMFQGVFRRI